MAIRAGFEAPWRAGGSGALALDFVNTLEWRLREAPDELLHSPADLLRWARTAGTLDAEAARGLCAWSEAHPRAAKRVLADAKAVREAIAAVFQAVARGEDVPARPLAHVEDAVRRAWAARVLRPAGSSATWEWRALEADRPALAAALDAERLLASSERERIRECADAQCGWLFLDASRNHSRRWCNMQACGNRNKARRWYRRQRADAAGLRN